MYFDVISLLLVVIKPKLLGSNNHQLPLLHFLRAVGQKIDFLEEGVRVTDGEMSFFYIRKLMIPGEEGVWDTRYSLEGAVLWTMNLCD